MTTTTTVSIMRPSPRWWWPCLVMLDPGVAGMRNDAAADTKWYVDHVENVLMVLWSERVGSGAINHPTAVEICPNKKAKIEFTLCVYLTRVRYFLLGRWWLPAPVHRSVLFNKHSVIVIIIIRIIAAMQRCWSLVANVVAAIIPVLLHDILWAMMMVRDRDVATAATTIFILFVAAFVVLQS